MVNKSRQKKKYTKINLIKITMTEHPQNNNIKTYILFNDFKLYLSRVSLSSVPRRVAGEVVVGGVHHLNNRVANL